MSSDNLASINFLDSKASYRIRSVRKLKKYLFSIFKKENKSLHSLNIVFCSDNELLKLNREFLSHDFYTDVITFALNRKGEAIIGEIYVSIDRVGDNAKKNNETFKRELHRVIIHGVLHLCGYNDKTSKDRKLMKEKEETYLNNYELFHVK